MDPLWDRFLWVPCLFRLWFFWVRRVFLVWRLPPWEASWEAGWEASLFLISSARLVLLAFVMLYARFNLRPLAILALLEFVTFLRRRPVMGLAELGGADGYNS